MRLLNFTQNDLKRQIELVTKESGLIKNLKRSVRDLNEHLLDERKKVKALSEELENPLNEHRYNLLQGMDMD